jgi:hypothetical protein
MSHSEPAADGEQILAWEGGDPVTFSRVLGALNEAGIGCVNVDQHRMSLFSNAFTKGFALVVNSTDHARASKIISDLLREGPSE